MQIIKGIAIAAVLIIAGLLALIVAAYLVFRIAAAIFEQQESWKDSGSRKGRKHDRKKLNTGYSRKARTVSAAACGADITIYAAGTYWEMWDYKARKQ
jgi:phosphate/sulfate permease